MARINARYGGLDIAPYPDLMCHEEPAYWAYGVFHVPDAAGRLPCGDKEHDRRFDVSSLVVRPSPAPGSPAWTLTE